MTDLYLGRHIITHKNSYEITDANYHEESLFYDSDEDIYYLQFLRGSEINVPFHYENRVIDILELEDLEAFMWLYDRDYLKLAHQQFGHLFDDGEFEQKLFTKIVFEITLSASDTPLIAFFNQDRISSGNSLVIEVIDFILDEEQLQLLGFTTLKTKMKNVLSIKQIGTWNVINNIFSDINTKKALNNSDTLKVLLDKTS